MNGQHSGYGNGLYVGRHNGRHGGLFAGQKKHLFAKKTAIAPPSEWDEDFLAFWERTSGTMNDDWKSAYNQLVKDLKVAGVWQKADALYIFASENEADARLNLIKDENTAVAHNSPTFSAKNGFAGNGSTSYIGTGFSPYNDGEKMSLNDICFCCYANTTYAGTYFGAWEGGATGGAMFTFVGGTLYRSISGSYLSGGVTDVAGLHALCRQSSSAQELFINGASSSENIPSGTVFSLYTSELDFLRRSDGAFYSAAQIAMGFAGAYLTPTQLKELENIVENFKTEIAAL